MNCHPERSEGPAVRRNMLSTKLMERSIRAASFFPRTLYLTLFLTTFLAVSLAVAQDRPENDRPRTTVRVRRPRGRSVDQRRPLGSRRTQDTNVWNAGVRYGWILTDPHLPGFLNGRFELAVDAVPAFAVFQRANTAFGGGVNRSVLNGFSPHADTSLRTLS